MKRNMDLLWEPSSQQSNYCRHFSVKPNNHCRQQTWAPQNNINMNSNKLKGLRKNLMRDGGGLSLENTWRGIGLIRCLWSFSRGCFGMGIDLFLLLVPWLGFWPLVETKGYFWAGEVGSALLHFLLFIVVCCDPWSSWSWLGHFFNFWIMGFFIGVKLTTFPDKIKYCRRPN